MGIFERFIGLLGLLCCVAAPIWYWGFADKGKRYDYAEAKRVMEDQVIYDRRITIYCEAPFDQENNAWAPEGFEARGHKRLRVNWEHAVPVSQLGAGFPGWQNMPAECKKSKKKLSRRQCLERTNKQFRKMTGDMYNLFPSLAPVNSARSDREYADLPAAKSHFGACAVKWAGGKFEPPDGAKGPLARAALYMDDEYEEFALKPEQRRLMEEWDSVFPVSHWECVRARRIEKLQGNENKFVKDACKKAGL